MFDRFVGIPYRDHGRGFDGCDCWGLVRLVFRETRGVDLPSFADGYVCASDAKAVADLIAGRLQPWDELPPGVETTGDVLLMRRGSSACHVGLVVEPGKVLHVSADSIASRVERYRNGLRGHRVVGRYRYRGQ
jgi:cell wall-associated NlpC family hydrolase